MSLLWRDRLIVGLSPLRLTVLRLGGGLYRRQIRQCEVSLEADDSATSWRPSLTAFQELVRDVQWQTTSVDFILSSHFVRYAVIPGDPNTQTEDERAALGAIVFRKTFGTLCQDWAITLSETQRGVSTLGAAIPKPLIEGLRAGVDKSTNIRSIRPDLMDSFNRVVKNVSSNPAIFLLVEPGRVTLGRIADDAWTSIVSRATPIDDTQACARLLAEEAELCPFAENAVIWIRDLTGLAVWPMELSGRVRTVPAPWPGNSATMLA